VKLRQEYEDLGEFVAAFRGKISRDGMLLLTDATHQVGTVLDVEIRLSDALVLVSGRAEVAGYDSIRPGVMVLRFLALDEQSAELVDRLEQRFVAEGGEIFRLNDVRMVGEPAAPGHEARSKAGKRLLVPEPAPVGEQVKSEAVTPAVVSDSDFPGALAGLPGQEVRSSEFARATGVGGRGLSFKALLLAGGKIAILGSAMAAIVLVAFYGFSTWRQRYAPADPTPLPRETVVADSGTPPVATVPAPTPAEDGGQPVASAPLASPTAVRAATAPATRVERISWTREGRATVAVLTFDGIIDDASVRHFRLDGPPRRVIQIKGIVEPYSEYFVAAKDPLLDRVRTWHHDQRRPAELHIVLDFARPEVQVESVTFSGNRLVVTLVDGVD
jgi:hypothetical protein